MRIKQLKNFIDLSHTTSLTKTAKNMHLSIPSLSESIDRMESEVGCDLFEKTSRGYFLNRKGEMFLHDIEPIVLQYQTALNRLEGFDVMKTLRFGIDTTIYPLFFSNILSHHQATCSEETVELICCQFSDFKNALLENKIDVCYSYKFSPFPKQLEFVPLFENSVCALMNKKHHLFNKMNLKVDDLLNETIYYDKEFETTQTKKIINYLAGKGTTIKDYDSPENPVSMLEVELNNGVMIMHGDKRDIYTSNMSLIPINGIYETYGLVFLKDNKEKYENIIKTMKEYF